MQLCERTGWHCSQNYYFCWKFDSWQRINIFPVSRPNMVILNIRGVKQLKGRFVWKNHSPPLGNAPQLPLLASPDPHGYLSGRQLRCSSWLEGPGIQRGPQVHVDGRVGDRVSCCCQAPGQRPGGMPSFFQWLADDNFGNARNAFLPASTRSVFERLTGLVTIFPVQNGSYRNPEGLCDMCTGFNHANGAVAGGDTLVVHHF